MTKHPKLINLTDSSGPNFSNIDPVVVHTLELLKWKASIPQNRRKSIPPVPTESGRKPDLSFDSFPEIGPEEAYEQTKTGVKALIFQLGFHGVESEALETLTKLALKKINKLAHTMQILQRRLRERRQCAQQVPILQTLGQHNLEPLAVHRFYHGRILERRNILQRQCENLYKKLATNAKVELEKFEIEEEEEEGEKSLDEEVEKVFIEEGASIASPHALKPIEKVPLKVAVKNVTKPMPRLTKLIQPIPIPGLELEPEPPKRLRPGYLIQAVKSTTSAPDLSQGPRQPSTSSFGGAENSKQPGSPVKSTVPQRQTRRRSPGIVSDTKAPDSKRGRR